jgi:SsrA-binding protein
MTEPHSTPVISNRKAFHDFAIDEELETGIVLQGCEVKMVRQGSFQLKDAFAAFDKAGELWLTGSHIPEYKQLSTHVEYSPDRKRKLLLHRQEAKRFIRKVREKGYTIVPLKAYFKQGKVKVLIGLARGKKLFDKRETIKQKDIKRELDRASSNREH